jgi:hypothetical protein
MSEPINVRRREAPMTVDRSRLRFLAEGVVFAMTLSMGRRVSAQAGPNGRITVYKEPT